MQNYLGHSSACLKGKRMTEKGICSFCGKETLVATSEKVNICLKCALLAATIVSDVLLEGLHKPINLPEREG